jgi:DNA-binding CsgD family transcriptional regulator
MNKEPIDRLSARHRDCLRLVASNHSSKEIALSLNLSPNTVDGYISEAKEILGAATRRDAARKFQVFDCTITPQKLGGVFSRVAAMDELLSTSNGDPENNLRGVASVAHGSPQMFVDTRPVTDSFHWFRGKRQHNSLSTGQRLIWIAVGSVIASMLFVVGLASIETLARLISHSAS